MHNKTKTNTELQQAHIIGPDPNVPLFFLGGGGGGVGTVAQLAVFFSPDRL